VVSCGKGRGTLAQGAVSGLLVSARPAAAESRFLSLWNLYVQSKLRFAVRGIRCWRAGSVSPGGPEGGDVCGGNGTDLGGLATDRECISRNVRPEDGIRDK